jgi:hypothetical protein
MQAQKVFNHFSPLSVDQLPASVVAEHAWSQVSASYKFLSTLDVVHALADVGLHPYLVKQSGTRIEGKEGYTKHLMRFRSSNTQALAGNVYPEVVLINAHDRASSFILELGLFRLVCSNGLVVSFGNWGKCRIRHIASSITDVLLGASAIVEQFPMIESHVSRMQSVMLSPTQAIEFATRAMDLRWESDKTPYEANRLLQTRRIEDKGIDLWSTFNVIQENLLRGQHVSRWGRFHHTGERVERSSREVKSIDMEMSINRGLWQLAESYAG